MFVGAVRKTKHIMSRNQTTATKADEYAVFQYLVLHWTVVMGYPKESLLNFTVLDFVNQEDYTYKILNCLKYPVLGHWKLEFCDWFHAVLTYYFLSIRSKWLAKSGPRVQAECSVMVEVFSHPLILERTNMFFVNGNGKVEIHIANVVALYQKKVDKKHKKNAELLTMTSASKALFLDTDIPVKVSQIIEDAKASHHDPFMADLFPLEMHSRCLIPSKRFMTSTQLHRQPCMDKVEARRLSNQHWRSLK